ESLVSESPPLAQIVSVERELIDCGADEKYSAFEIRVSESVGGERVLISPDVAVCHDCLREMYRPNDRRYRYPFLNCTNCGPRFTIIEDLPYDRPKTTMREFAMCESCECEYSEPSDRRFHAQPTCCPVCGPELYFTDSNGVKLDSDPINLTIDFLREGKIIAIKGIGGFHLACDATNPDAVARLRERKHRYAKPLAVMVGGISAARRLGEIGGRAEAALLSPARPILIVPENPDSPIADRSINSVTGGVGTIGIMLPYAPLHHLLFRPLPIEPPENTDEIILPEEIGGPADAIHDAFQSLVMTSGNISDEPISIDNDDAIKLLGGVVDGFLLNDRRIHRRCDDSVAAIRDNEVTIWRWGRGHVPRPVILPEPLPSVLAVGGELRNTICHIRKDKAFLSPHIGDLKTFEAYEYFTETIEHQEIILDCRPEFVACDLHPDYHSTRWAEDSGLPVMKIQHHHAHAVALMAECNALNEEIIVLAMDGTGYGTDGHIWGSEILKCTVSDFERHGHFTYAPLPGGDLAVREVWRNALGRLFEQDKGLPGEFRKLFSDVPDENVGLVEKMICSGINSPLVDSLGRIFDAAAFIAGLGSTAGFDGMHPMRLESEARSAVVGHFPKSNEKPEKFFIHDEKEGLLLDAGQIIREMADMRLSGKSTGELALWFHETI
ncbi:MAG: carbamoyltransferase HypF, partial [bacterium]